MITVSMSALTTATKAVIRGSVIFTAALLVAVSMAGPVSAHTALRSTTPGDGKTVPPPDQVTLTFNEAVRFTQVLVFDGERRHYEAGKSSVADTTVTQRIAGVLPDGQYSVAWRVVAADGHPLTGSYRFTVTGSTAGAAGATGSPAAAPGATAGATAGAAAPNTTSGNLGKPAGATPGTSSSARLWWLVLGALAVMGGGIAALRFRRRSKPDADAQHQPPTGSTP